MLQVSITGVMQTPEQSENIHFSHQLDDNWYYYLRDHIVSGFSSVGKLPSQFQIGALVTLNFGSAGKVTGADIIKVHFSESKVLYDVDVLMSSGGADGKVITRLYNIDSCFVEPAE